MRSPIEDLATWQGLSSLVLAIHELKSQVNSQFGHDKTKKVVSETTQEMCYNF